MEFPSPPWIHLPLDLTANIIGRLDIVEILESVQRVCTTWWKLCKDYPVLWRIITMKNDVVGFAPMRRRLATLCRIAVDRSQGQLIELDLDGFGDIKLLNYVADRSSKLRSLKIDNCVDLEIYCLTEAVKKLPHLEELQITRMPLLKPGDIEIIGVSCPVLKSLIFNLTQVGQDYGVNCSNHVQAIAKTMPNLCRLSLVGLWIRNRDLEAILDGCPLLASLDLAHCDDFDLRESLCDRCCKQVEYLRLPFHPRCLFDRVYFRKRILQILEDYEDD